jgi:hypothetical protein
VSSQESYRQQQTNWWTTFIRFRKTKNDGTEVEDKEL